MRNLRLLAVLAWPASAHVLSMSSGEIRIEGDRAHYELFMPLYEIAHVKDLQASLFAHISFSAEGRAAQLIAHDCREASATGQYVCTADYRFPVRPVHLEVECTFPAITVPNHVHLLRAEKDGLREQAMFDVSFPGATLHFAPPNAAEIFFRQFGAGFVRALGGPVQILFLLSLVLAARSLRELAAVSGMFLVGETAVAILIPMTTWFPPPRFVEAAAALALAYLAAEILFLPSGGFRWLIAGLLGGFQGLYLTLVLRTSGYSPFYVLAGGALAQMVSVALFVLVFSRVERMTHALRPVQVAASVLFAAGMTWFFLRLKG